MTCKSDGAGLHIIWTTYNVWQPQDARGAWLDLRKLYAGLEQGEHTFELSKPLPHGNTREAVQLPAGATVLTPDEVNQVEGYLAELVAPDGDRLVAGLPVVVQAVRATAVQLLLVPELAEHNQAVGRLKSKTASWLLRSRARGGQRHLWSGGYWFARLADSAGVEKVERFLQQQRQ